MHSFVLKTRDNLDKAKEKLKTKLRERLKNGSITTFVGLPCTIPTFQHGKSNFAIPEEHATTHNFYYFTINIETDKLYESQLKEFLGT